MQPIIIFLDDNLELRELLQSIVEDRLQVNCAGYSSVYELKNATSTALQSQIAVLDLELGFKQPSGIDAYNWLVENHYAGHVFFLTGHGQSNPLVESAAKFGATIWEKPISSSQIMAHFKKALATSKAPEPITLSKDAL